MYVHFSAHGVSRSGHHDSQDGAEEVVGIIVKVTCTLCIVCIVASVEIATTKFVWNVEQKPLVGIQIIAMLPGASSNKNAK